MAATASAAAALALASPAGAAAPALPLHCATYPPPDGPPQEICSGQVDSFDGSNLDVDLTKPLNDRGPGKHPLIVMLNGFGNTKHEWESLTDEGDGADKWHWNSRWFAKHGYYVLTYTPRGFCHKTDVPPPPPPVHKPCQPEGNHGEGTQAPWRPETPSFTSRDSPSGTIQIKSREIEIRDTQWLAALVAANHPSVDANRLAVTGGSYGGGESWTQASQAQWTFPHEQNADLPVLQLQAAIPKYPWTDQAYSLAVNGHPRPPGCPAPNAPPGDDPYYESAQGCWNSDTGEGNPIGVEKLSYVNGLFASGELRGTFEQGTRTTPNTEGPINIEAWNARFSAIGDPYNDADPLVREVRRGLTEYRGAYYQEEDWQAQAAGRKVAIFSIQGWTDDLFTAVESFRMFKFLKRLDPRWPVEVAMADVGHARAQNKPEQWRRLNVQAWQFLQSNIQGSHERRTTVSSEPTICPGDPNQAAAQRLTATTPEGLANGALTVQYDAPGSINSPGGVADPQGPRTDPVLGEGGCQESEGDPGFAFNKYSRLSAPLDRSQTYVGLGFVTLPAPVISAATATVNVRVWDKPPEGPERLVSRGAYRYDAPAYDTPGSPRLRVPLFGNHFTFDPGHRIRLEVTLVDFPFLRPSNVPSQATFGPPSLTLPTRQAGERTLGP